MIDVIFSVGGLQQSSNANAFIIDPTQYYQTKNNSIDVYYHKLPDLLGSVNGSQALYSQKQGLIQIGNSIYNNTHPFNVFSFNDYKWNKIKQAMNTERSFLTSIMINDNKLFCCFGVVTGYVADTDIHNYVTIYLKK